MKKIIRLSVMMAIVLFGLISAKTTLAETTETITEDAEWSGTVGGSKVFTFTPTKTGFYNVKITDTADTYTSVTFLTENNEPVMSEISEVYDGCATGIYIRNAIFLFQNKEYKVEIECRDYADEDKDFQLMEGDVSLLISKSSDTALPLTEYKKTTNAIINGNSICSYTPTDSGTYSFTFESKTNEIAFFYVDLYSIEGETFNKINKTLRWLYDPYNSISFQLEAGKEYYFFIRCLSYYEDGHEDGLEVASHSSIQKKDNITSIELNKAPLLCSTYNYIPTYSGSIKIYYENGKTEILDIDDMNPYDIDIEYLGERDSKGYFIAGKQKVKYTYIDNFEVTTDVDVLTRVQYAEKVYGSISTGQKITVKPSYWYNKEFKFTPSENGYYGLWSNPPLSDMYNSWEFRLYDSNDKEVEFVPEKGFKLKANEDYWFNIILTDNLTENNFVYWLGINTKHTHTYGPWVTTSPATTTQPGTEERTCTECGAVEKNYTSKLPPSTDGGNSVQNSEMGSPAPTNSTLAKTTIKSVKAKKKGTIIVNWKKTANSKGYQIQYSTNKKFKSKKTKTTTKTSLTIKKLKKKKTYYIRVRAYKTVNGKKIYGKWSSVKSIKIKK